MSNSKQIGTRLVELCRQGKNIEAVESLYADDAVSVEATEGGDQFPREVSGKSAILEKNRWWGANHEVHSGEAEGPFPHGDDRFAVVYRYDVTHKPSGQRMQMDEVAIYRVAGGKIAREEFYYNAG